MKYVFAHILCSFLDRFVWRKPLTGTPVFLYHGIGEKRSRLFVSTEAFERHMRYLHENGWKSVAPRDLARVRPGDKAFLITFDDGFSSVYDRAFPIVQKYGFTATVFVTTSALGLESAYAREPYDRHHRLMGEKELRVLAAHGWCIANHTASHKDLTRLSAEDISLEYRESAAALERMGFAEFRNIVAYPFNCYTESVMMTFAREGVRLAFAGDNRLHTETSKQLAIPRLDVTNSFTRFKLMLSPSFHRLRAIRRSFAGD